MQIEVTFIGNATTLIRYGQITLLTDPNFLHQGQHAYLGYGLVSKRRKPPALTIEELPALDGIVLSHMHGDHWDRVAQKNLDHNLPIITTPHAQKRLDHRGFHRAHGLQTWQEFSIDKSTGEDQASVTITALPGRHAPTPLNRFLPPVMGSMLDFSSGDGARRRRLYISGDTLLIDELAEIPARFQSIDAGVLHLGGTRLPAGDRLPFGLTVTMDGRQGTDLAALLRLPKVIPVHFDDYGVFASPLSDFVAAMADRGLDDRIVEVDRGQTITV
ncbi:MBL fold metallo-hydrolase [Mycolicibacterium vaccae]|uniref:MBL fold metallo-hydrolase n=1 Tax=Mycolicibacterium vaccae TaxID=1810 RepID=UPI003CF0F903